MNWKQFSNISFYSHSVLPFIPRPQECKNSSEVVIEATYEKHLCYIPRNVFAFTAKQQCENLGMELYVHNTSVSSRQKLYEFGRSVLNGNRKAKVYISGRRRRRCLIYLPRRRYSFVRCQIPHTFVCQYHEISKQSCCFIM